jgi:hypothetical protein
MRNPNAAGNYSKKGLGAPLSLSMDYTSLPSRAVLGGFEYFRVSGGASQVTLRAC